MEAKDNQDVKPENRAAQIPLQRFVILCFHCRHWNGDKEQVAKAFAKNPIYMDLEHGWPESGSCSRECEWSDIEVHGNASITLEVDANFGCPYGEV